MLVEYACTFGEITRSNPKRRTRAKKTTYPWAIFGKSADPEGEPEYYSGSGVLLQPNPHVPNGQRSLVRASVWAAVCTTTNTVGHPER